MQTLSNRINKPTVGRVQLSMHPMLFPPAVDHASQQNPRSGDAGGDLSLPREPWPGARSGVRAPRFGETPLSAEEVKLGLALGVFQ